MGVARYATARGPQRQNGKPRNWLLYSPCCAYLGDFESTRGINKGANAMFAIVVDLVLLETSGLQSVGATPPYSPLHGAQLQNKFAKRYATTSVTPCQWLPTTYIQLPGILFVTVSVTSSNLPTCARSTEVRKITAEVPGERGESAIIPA